MHQEASADKVAGLESAVPAAADTTTAAPWSACRLWDPKPIFASGPEGEPDTDQEQQLQQQQLQHTDKGSRFRLIQHDAESSRDGSDAAAAHDDTVMLEADDDEGADEACTTSRCLGLSCGEHHVQASVSCNLHTMCSV